MLSQSPSCQSISSSAIESQISSSIVLMEERNSDNLWNAISHWHRYHRNPILDGFPSITEHLNYAYALRHRRLLLGGPIIKTVFKSKSKMNEKGIRRPNRYQFVVASSPVGLSGDVNTHWNDDPKCKQIAPTVMPTHAKWRRLTPKTERNYFQVNIKTRIWNWFEERIEINIFGSFVACNFTMGLGKYPRNKGYIV